MIELQRLQGFYFVAIHGGYARAARAFPYPITQPGVFRQVQRLEEELGKPLFERTGRDQVALTSEGRTLFDFCAPIFQRLPEVLATIAEGQFGGTLRMLVAPMQMRLTVPPWLGRIKARRPDISFMIEERHDSALTRLLQHEVDIVVDFVGQPPPGVALRTLALNHGFLIVPHAWARRRKRATTLADLSDEPFVAYEPSTLEYRAQRAGLAGAGVTQAPQIHVSSTEAILALVAAGLGYSLIAWPDPKGPRHKGVTAVPLAGRSQFPISVAYRERKPVDPLVQAALAAL